MFVEVVIGTFQHFNKTCQHCPAEEISDFKLSTILIVTIV